MVTLILTMAAVLSGCQAPAANDPIATPRPEWLELAKQQRLPLHAEAISGKLWATRDEARDDVIEMAAARTLEFAAESVPRIKHRWQVPAHLVRDHFLSEPIFIEEVEWTYGPMYRAHALIDLAPEKRDLLLAQWHEVVLRERLEQIAGGLAFVFVCLITLFGYLRLDEATRGYYTRWLFAGASTLVAGSAAALYTWLV
jgi:hypothetical protein